MLPTFGSAIANGEYALDRKGGLKPGKYRVRITAADGKTPASDEEAGAPGGSTNIVSVDLIPAEWNVNSTQQIEVTSSGDNTMIKPRGPKINSFLSIIRGCQDIMGMLVYSGVFERHPKLRVVCVEADAGWAPHFMYRMDHAYKRHRYWMKGKELRRLPSEYFRDHIALTFQDDWTAFQFANLMAPNQLMWANDFPHSDSTWPWSKDVIADQTSHLDPVLKKRILHDNVAELYKLAA